MNERPQPPTNDETCEHPPYVSQKEFVSKQPAGIETRRRVYDLLREGHSRIGDIAQRLSISRTWAEENLNRLVRIGAAEKKKCSPKHVEYSIATKERATDAVTHANDQPVFTSLPNERLKRLSTLAKCMENDTRCAFMERLLRQKQSAPLGEHVKALNVEQSTLSQLIHMLIASDYISMEQHGKEHHYVPTETFMIDYRDMMSFLAIQTTHSSEE
jgi:Mn-dependent DtxR family transcriptional regulator